MVVIEELGFFMDGILYKNLSDLKEDIRKDDDGVILIDGKERAGKSVLGLQLGAFLADGKLTIDDVSETPKQFMDWVKSAPKYSVGIFDEAYLGMASADHYQYFNRLLKKMLVTCGQKNLILIIILPSVFDVSKYVAMHRADFLLHVYKKDGVRGNFLFFSQNRLNKLYIFGKKTYSYNQPANFYGKFPNHYPIDEEAYRKKKHDALAAFLSSEDDEGMGKRALYFAKAVNYIKIREPHLTNQSISNILGCHASTISKTLSKFKDFKRNKVTDEVEDET